MDKQPIPGGIGPHEGRELELMLAGEKPLAMFGDALGSGDQLPEADFAPHVAAGTIVRREVVYRPPKPRLPGRYVYFALAGEEWRVDAMHRINEVLFVVLKAPTPAMERKIGELLGYSGDEIDQYLAWSSAQGPAATDL